MGIRSQMIVRPAVIYEETDGQPMAENTLQFQWIVTIKEGIDVVFRHDPLVFVAGDLFWYPVEGNNRIRSAPDTMVVFGAPKGHRRSYLQWEEDGIAPQVVFEVLSPSNTEAEMQGRFEFFQKYGVEEYYLYDPDGVVLRGWIRQGHLLVEIEQMDGWKSPRLGVRFDMSGEVLRLIGPDGVPFATYAELYESRAEAVEQMVEQRRRAEAERRRAERERRRAEKEQQRAEKEQQRAETERHKAERLAAQLRSLGIEPEV